ncbi:uncharacterized protein [Macrobrachium rosenbergii]|uniref:uncharacterized protein n=1 Tax=Macrobrachium rosenbergii TaxID=79674 RepID=UPI0034D644C1
MDVSSVFLNGKLSEKLYMTQPEGFIEKWKENFVYKLDKAIYGLKQAPKCWNSSLDAYLKSLKFQQSKIKAALSSKYKMKDLVNCTLEKATEESDLFSSEICQSAVGSLLYLSTRTRPDITFAVCNVAKFCTNPTKYHWSAVKRIFRYLRGTCDLGIVYSKQNSCFCVGYSDADWAGDKNDSKSTSGYCFSLSSGLISWRTNKQSCVALSTAEAEYVALSSAAQEAVG